MKQDRIRVELGERSYEIHISHESLTELGEALKSFGFSNRVAILTNPTVQALYGDIVRQSIEQAGFEAIFAEMPDGEEYKNLKTCERLWDRLLKERLDRKSPVIALGGGVVGDVAGFIAATYMRGIPFVQVPTTLLAQVDSSVGGKTGIDHAEGKNLIGAFYQPKLVWIDPATLKTLEPRELRCGLAEVVKYGVIADEAFFSFLEDEMEAILRLEPEVMGQLVGRCCEIKAEIVAQDEREGGIRAILNFGHTIGHAIEAQASYQGLKHGEAVAMGMVAETRLAIAEGIAEPETLDRLETLLQKIGLDRNLPSLDPSSLIHIMTVDKKAQAGSIRIVLPEKIGKVRLPEPILPERLLPVLKQSISDFKEKE